MSHKQQIEPKIYAFLSELVNVPTRDAKLALEGRARFLAQLETFEYVPTANRHPSQLTFRTALALVLIGILLLSGTIAVAAQNALPTASLYPVKL